MTIKACRFDTKDLLVSEWHSSLWEVAGDLEQVVCDMLSPAVTRSLPEAWQGDYTKARAGKWIDERDCEGAALLALERMSGSPAGLMILAEDNDGKGGRSVRLGYLIGESFWGRGLASELVSGFVQWCRENGISAIVSGVDRNNAASRRVLEKNGFTRKQDCGDQAELFFELQL